MPKRTLKELRDLLDKKLNLHHYDPNAEVFIDGEMMDPIVDVWLCANKKIALVGASTIEKFRKMAEEDGYEDDVQHFKSNS